ncbi:SLC13 family permease [Clostridium sp. KNHs216]|uniref:SLC13 family permease n=1 Tax=Clostridium sp. KNHs216 TaxID=1550235 RepID=UPI001152E3F2|nr:SLC13 family permease [Clostridium sp. KNHs216]TQI66656.1 di/tricarboxylate transporter [Clostridium sp. KNHs216]
MELNMALISLIAVIVLFVIGGLGAIQKNPIHLGLMGLLLAFIVGKMAGIKETEIMGFFPTALFVRVFGIMFFFAITQVNGSIELLAKKLLAKVGKNAKLIPFFLFYVGVFLSSIGINSLAGMAILSGIGISLAHASNGKPLLYGLAGAYGIACGCYSPINEYTINITTAAESSGLHINLVYVYLFCLVAFSVSFFVVYLILGGLQVKGSVETESVTKELPKFSRAQMVSLLGIIAVVALVVLFNVDIGWSGIIVGIACLILGACNCADAVKKVSLSSLMLICGVGTLINLVSKLGGFQLMSSALASIMSTNTVAPIMSFTASIMAMFTLSRLVVLTLIPTIPGIIASIPSASATLAIIGTSAGAFAACMSPLGATGAIVMSNLVQQYGEKEAQSYFAKQILMGIVGALVVALVCFVASVLGIFSA